MQPDLFAIEEIVSSMLQRVTHRCETGAASQQDGTINMSVRKGLETVLDMTRAYASAQRIYAHDSGYYSLTLHEHYLARFAPAAPVMTRMLETMDRLFEGQDGLSPLFRRMAHREYGELQNIAARLRQVIDRDSQDLAVPGQETRTGTDLTFMFMPYIIASSSFMAGCDAARTACFEGWNEMMKTWSRAVKPRPAHLKLVVDNT